MSVFSSQMTIVELYIVYAFHVYWEAALGIPTTPLVLNSLWTLKHDKIKESFEIHVDDWSRG